MTPELVQQWAREAGIPDVVHATNPPAFERFAALACAWQAEQDATRLAATSGYKEGYRDGYNRCNAEIKGLFA